MHVAYFEERNDEHRDAASTLSSSGARSGAVMGGEKRAADARGRYGCTMVDDGSRGSADLLQSEPFFATAADRWAISGTVSCLSA